MSVAFNMPMTRVRIEAEFGGDDRLFVPSDNDSLKLPVVQLNRKNLLIERVEIDMEPSIGLFEEELCRLINKDRMEKKKMTNTTVTSLVQDVSQKVSIVERRLRVRSHADGHDEG